jgi:hypothetical protein
MVVGSSEARMNVATPSFQDQGEELFDPLVARSDEEPV